jgi:putative tricarboxylic transport membrane protein
VADDLTGSSNTPASRTARLIGFAVLGAFGAYALIVAINLGLWRGRSPGEGLFPFLTAAAMLAFSAAGIVVALRAPRDEATPGRTERPQLLRMGFYLAMLLFYALTLESLGFIAATIISIGAILRFAERYSWRVVLAIAVTAAAGCHVLFAKWLGAILPAGTLWERFGG